MGNAKGKKKTIHQRKDMRTTARQINTRYLDKSCRTVDRAAGRGTPVYADHSRQDQDKHWGFKAGGEPTGDKVDPSKRVGRSE